MVHLHVNDFVDPAFHPAHLLQDVLLSHFDGALGFGVFGLQVAVEFVAETEQGHTHLLDHFLHKLFHFLLFIDLVLGIFERVIELQQAVLEFLLVCGIRIPVHFGLVTEFHDAFVENLAVLLQLVLPLEQRIVLLLHLLEELDQLVDVAGACLLLDLVEFLLEVFTLLECLVILVCLFLQKLFLDVDLGRLFLFHRYFGGHLLVNAHDIVVFLHSLQVHPRPLVANLRLGLRLREHRLFGLIVDVLQYGLHLLVLLFELVLVLLRLLLELQQVVLDLFLVLKGLLDLLSCPDYVVLQVQLFADELLEGLQLNLLVPPEVVDLVSHFAVGGYRLVVLLEGHVQPVLHLFDLLADFIVSEFLGVDLVSIFLNVEHLLCRLTLG